MLKHFSLLLLLIFFLRIEVSAQSKKENFNQLKTTEKNLLSNSQLDTFIDSLSQILPSTPIGKFIKKPLSIADSEKQDLNNHLVYNWKIETQNLGIHVFFDLLTLKDGDSLFTYSLEGNLLEITTQKDLYGKSFTSSFSKNGLIFQLKNYSNKVELHISGYSLEKIESQNFKTQDFGESNPCQVNVNCSEGENFRDIQKSVVRILIKIDLAVFWCTGSLINNTAYNYEPYILSAEHCGLSGSSIAPQSDLDNWTFYFNYESPDCDNPISEGNLNNQRLTGATALANSQDGGGDFGSDFLLLKLSSNIPIPFNAYYSGWSHQGKSFPQNGVGIHHPSGDIKKISTFQFTAESGSFGNTVDNTHWVVEWQKTFNGHGTTEQGSSGSPLFDENDLIRGVLTGGGSACNNLKGKDFYGKLSYSWNSNGTANDRRLDVWLDPNNTGYLAINGAFEGDEKPALNGDSIKIFPIPAYGDFIEIQNIGRPQEDLSISVFSLQGKKMYSTHVVSLPGENYFLDIKGWPQGMYIILFDQNGAFKEKKFVIVRN